MTRGTGETTRQMQGAPKHAIFVWPVRNSIGYAEDLARKLGRDDLEIVTLSWLKDRRWQGREITGLVLDHACVDHRMTACHWKAYRQAEARVRALTD